MSLAYSLSISPPNWVDLPAPRFGSDYQTIKQNDVKHETDGGQIFVYPLFVRREWRLEFRVLTESGLDVFRTLHQAVNGQLTPFYIDLNNVTLYCRKESDFSPRMMTVPTDGRVYDYTLTLIEELPA